MKRHSPDTLTRAAKQTWSQSYSNRPTMGTNFPVKLPTLGRTCLIKCPHLPRLPPPPLLGLNIDRCIRPSKLQISVTWIQLIILYNYQTKFQLYKIIKSKIPFLQQLTLLTYSRKFSLHISFNSRTISSMHGTVS